MSLPPCKTKESSATLCDESYILPLVQEKGPCVTFGLNMFLSDGGLEWWEERTPALVKVVKDLHGEAPKKE